MAPKRPQMLGVGDEFEGRRIVKTTIAVTNAGDGLSNAMKIDPQSLHQGDTVYVVLECEVGKIGFDPFADEVCARVQTLKAGVATIIDRDSVSEAIEAQRTKIREAEDAAAGRQDFLKLAEDHDNGLHDSPAPGCPKCAPQTDDTAGKPEANGDGEPASIKKRAGRAPRTKATTADEKS